MRNTLQIALLSLALLAGAATTGNAFSLSELFGGKESNKEQQTQKTPAPAASRQARQAEFLKRIRKSDPSRQTIQKAVFNQQNELGLVLGHGVQMDSIPLLLKGLLIQEAKVFPGEDLTIYAYAPANPPIKIGTAHLNARTRDMTYTPARK